MKRKFLAVFAAAALSVLPFAAACDKGGEEGEGVQPVTLVAIDGTQVGVADCDYYVVPEPAASTKVNAIAELNFAGDLQKLYGGENGYPQAVVVAKSELVKSYDFCAEFAAALKENAEWLAAETTAPHTIVNAVSSHLTEGMSPTFNAKNLSKQVIANCGVKFVSAKESKAEIKAFMTEINAVAESPFGTPEDKFFAEGFGSGNFEGNLKVVAPDGAPALGLAKMLAGEKNFDGVNIDYEIVNSSLIQTYVGGNSPKADICVLPVNLAVKLLGSGEKYSLLGTLTHGNLFLLSKTGKTIENSNISDLSGKRVGVVNLAAVPGLTFKLILKKNNIAYTV